MKMGFQEVGSRQVKLMRAAAARPVKIPIAFHQDNRWQEIKVKAGEPGYALLARSQAAGGGKAMNPNIKEIYQLLIICVLAGGLIAGAASPARLKSPREDQAVSLTRAYHDSQSYHGAKVPNHQL